jgi:MoxR-like ATPase
MMTQFSDFFKAANDFLPGNQLQIRLGLIALILRKNVLIEDVPGMGKTTLVKFFAQAAGMNFRRIQFTSDLLPSDIIGVSIFKKEDESFFFKPGPIFAELVLADELNRGTPKAQSALLQAMEEKNITVDGVTHPLPEHFCVFATQNPRGQFGTHPLPESQLDRFFFKFSMGQLNQEEEEDLLRTGSRSKKLETCEVILTKSNLAVANDSILSIKVSPVLLRYISDILKETRFKEDSTGLSPRAGLDLLDASRAWAFFEGRDYVIPDDVQSVFPFVAGHRMFSGLSYSIKTELFKSKELITKVAVFRENQ